MKIKQREYTQRCGETESLHQHPVLQRVYQTRGIESVAQLQRDLQQLLPFQDLLNIDQAAKVLADAIMNGQHLMIIGDYDADGATSTALAVRALRQFGAAKVSFIVPNRFEYGYGLTPEIVALGAKQQPDLLMTVDNGIASNAGVAAANALNIKVVVTDHHLPGDATPDAAAIVNPNQHGCSFSSKALAGVGVCFYVMLALRRELEQQHWFATQNITKPNMANFLDLVALGTVADVVPLDHNNRVLVHQGLRRIRAGRCVTGITALLTLANRCAESLQASDLGFAVGPRLNAAGRLDDMSLGITCLLTDDPQEAQRLAHELNDLNLARRDIEADMKIQAFEHLKKLDLSIEKMPYGLCLFNENWHQGVIGILASRLKEQYHRPVIIFADAGKGEIKGSARSVKGVHIRDVLDAIAKQHPTLISKFGGHAMAAGLSIQQQDYNDFSQAFDQEVRKHLLASDLQGEILTDGYLSSIDINLPFAELLQESGPWGQAFPEPIFQGEFGVIEQRIVGQNHLKLSLKPFDNEKIYSAIYFNIDLEQWPNHRCQSITAAYQLAVNEYKGFRNVQLLLHYIAPSENHS